MHMKRVLVIQGDRLLEWCLGEKETDDRRRLIGKRDKVLSRSRDHSQLMSERIFFRVEGGGGGLEIFKERTDISILVAFSSDIVITTKSTCLPQKVAQSKNI